MSADENLSPQQFHEMTRTEFEAQPDTYFHGSMTGSIGGRPGHPQFHVGTYRAALQATGARAHGGAPGGVKQDAEGHYYQPDEPYHEAIAKAQRTRSPNINIVGGRIVGPMANMPQTDPRREARFGRAGIGDYQGRAPYAYGDWAAGGMENRLKKQGVYYKNQGEDEGSISAILPNRSHFMTHEDYLVKARAEGKTIPPRALQGYKEIPGQQQFPLGPAGR